ncbi:MAG: FeS assembly protein IscX [Pseudohongiellaceae bacterium]|jgi:FeS assembly protein IscX
MDEFTWTDTEEIGFRLYEARPTIDPLTIRFTDLHTWVCELEGFQGATDKSGEKILEAIQMAWLEEFRDNADA